MISSGNIASLQILSSDLLDDTLTAIRLHREQSSPPNKEYFLTAEYLSIIESSPVSGLAISPVNPQASPKRCDCIVAYQNDTHLFRLHGMSR